MSEEKKKGSAAQSRNTKKENGETKSPRRKTESDGAQARITDGKAEKVKKEPNPSSVGNQLAIILLVVLSIFIGICYAFPGHVGVIGNWIQVALFGVFGASAFLVPFLLLQLALFWRRDVKNGAVKYKYLVALAVLLFLAVIIHTIFCLANGIGRMSFGEAFTGKSLGQMFNDGKAYHGGGFLGGVLASALICAFGPPGTLIFSILFFVMFGLALFGLTPAECWQRIRFYRQRQKGARRVQKEKQEVRRAERAENARVAAENRARRAAERAAAEKAAAEYEASRKRAAGIDSSVFADNAVFGGAEEPVAKSEVLYPIGTLEHDAEPEDGKIKLDDIFDTKDDEEMLTKYATPEEMEEYEDLTEDVPLKPQAAQMELKVEKKPVVTPKPQPQASAPARSTAPAPTPTPTIIPPAPREKAAPVVPAPAVAAPVERQRDPYMFPPITLLKQETSKQNTDVSAELRENADRIIQTLDSFNVHVKISNVSRGPTITRYEVEPSAGTRVRSIINLLDDIALSLATSGVRSDGIIAGKSAIGIEVPNKTTSTVYIRELIEDKQFEEAKSKLTTSLGMDVSGSPVYLDVAKMPHLLIAGTTGSGKSVCINSLLVSMLYKARPDEVKLILIDPKKVELNIYNGIPHLLVPVIFDPKKAAGSLHWAVTEMERRFELLEAHNVRNLAQYNAAIADDPNKEVLPQIVIIIDELADFMMMAPDDVEASICRLAQKARAAGMHLIIGTQRPTVDVITGLIKANIPSRIAFTVGSQIDSRTIIDTQGAEKLIGRGDMLYAPIGATKPIRVQGAFVSEKEIEEVVEFIKQHSKDCAYSSDVIEQIDKAAELCGQKKGKGAASAAMADDDGGEEEDPMLDAAIELAVESGKISTSLIQRRLSLGYGRAAKLIDVMERRGIVSAPEGQKPRSVLITREQYLEMKMNHADAGAAASAATEDDDPPFDI